MESRIALIVPLPPQPQRALTVLQAVASLPETPAHDVVLVDASGGALADVLALVEGDVSVLPAPARGPATALALAAQRTSADVLAVLDEDALPQGDWLAPLVDALDRPGVAATTSLPGLHGLATRRTDVAALATTPADLPAVALALAASGAVVPVPASAVELAAPAPAAHGAPLELSIVIPTLDAGSERVRAALAALAATTDVPHEVILVHNGAAPQGFSAPVNGGLRAASAPYVVVMNDDVEPQPGWWAPLRAELDAGAAVVFPRTIDGFERHDFAAWCFAMTREAMERHAVAPGAFFDPELVVHFQDIDLLLRLRAAGTPPVHVPASTIRHGLSQTLESDDAPLRAWVGRQIALDAEAFDARHPGVLGASQFVRTR